MIVFVPFKKLFQTFLWLFTAAALCVFYQFIGLNMFFLLVIGLLALKFVPVLVLPILLIGVGVHFSGDFSFIADGIVWGFWGLVSLPICYAFAGTIHSTMRQRKQEIK